MREAAQAGGSPLDFDQGPREAVAPIAFDRQLFEVAGLADRPLTRRHRLELAQQGDLRVEAGAILRQHLGRVLANHARAAMGCIAMAFRAPTGCVAMVCQPSRRISNTRFTSSIAPTSFFIAASSSRLLAYE